MKIEQVITRITVPDGDPHDIEVIVTRKNDRVMVGFYGYTSTVSERRHGWEIHLTHENAETLLRGLQDLGGPARSPEASERSRHLHGGE